MTRTTKTPTAKGGATKRKSAARARATPAEGLEETLVVDRGQGCYLLCFEGALPEAKAWAPVLSMLTLARPLAKGRPPWVVFGGDSPMHWRGLTRWVLISEAVPEKVFSALAETLRQCGPGEVETVELTTPAREPFIEPLFSVQDDGARLLMSEGNVDAAWRDTLAGVPLRQRGWTWASARRGGAAGA